MTAHTAILFNWSHAMTNNANNGEAVQWLRFLSIVLMALGSSVFHWSGYHYLILTESTVARPGTIALFGLSIVLAGISLGIRVNLRWRSFGILAGAVWLAVWGMYFNFIPLRDWQPQYPFVGKNLEVAMVLSIGMIVSWAIVSSQYSEEKPIS
jgi:hypothetical protein